MFCNDPRPSVSLSTDLKNKQFQRSCHQSWKKLLNSGVSFLKKSYITPVSEALGEREFSRQLQTISHHGVELFYCDLSFEKIFLLLSGSDHNVGLWKCRG